MVAQSDSFMTLSRRHTLQVLAAAIASAVAPAAAQEMEENADVMPKTPPAMERCYGVALAGQNDCGSSEPANCAGSATKDYDPLAFKNVPVGTCTQTLTPAGFGSLEPVNHARNEAM
jgi:uncharacterized membrane protein